MISASLNQGGRFRASKCGLSYRNTYLQSRNGGAGQLPVWRASVRKHLPRTAQLRLARTRERIEIDMGINFLVTGGTQKKKATFLRPLVQEDAFLVVQEDLLPRRAFLYAPIKARRVHENGFFLYVEKTTLFCKEGLNVFYKESHLSCIGIHTSSSPVELIPHQSYLSAPTQINHP